jgi:ATP-binding cassette subfamily C protein
VKKYEYKRADDISDMERHSGYLNGLMYNFSYGKDMRIYGLSDWIGSLFKNYKMNRYEIHRSIKLKYQKVGIIEIIFLIVREGLVYAYLIYQVMNSGLGIGSFTMYFAAIANFANAMKVIMDDIAHIRAQSLYVTDLRNFMNQRESTGKEHPTSIPEGPYEIEFRKVSFKYPGSDNYVYKNISFKIKAGQKLAIVGHNGAGKTTLIKLLCRMYEPESGEILINGINIQEFAKLEYYKLFTAVFQEIKTLAFSVAENISLTEEKVNEEAILKCLEKTDMKDKVLSLKNGIHTSMQKILDDEGVEFSGGETQRIVLARALYKDAGIVILDEPTAALDALAERNIYEKFNEMVEGKTAIFISHRLASTSFCDIIALFEDGALVEYGTHEQLLEQNGKYADMFRVQAQYYKEDENEQQEHNISDNAWQCS